MTWLTTILILIAAFLAVFWQAAFQGIRHLLGAQVDLLPGLMVYTGLYGDLLAVSLLAVLGGLWFDSLSANPLGVTVLPLFLMGLAINLRRELLLREQVLAQFILGLAASACAPALTLMLLLSTGHKPLVGWGTLWQLAVMSLGGGLVTPIWFVLFEWFNRVFSGGQVAESSFRQDREIRRGR